MDLSLDLRHNLRLLRKNAGFVGICILIIGLGMGVSITLYTIGKNIGIKSPPLPNGERYVNVGLFDNSGPAQRWQWLDGYMFRSLESTSRNFKTLGVRRDTDAVLSDGERAERFYGTKITSNLLQATEVAPILGRNLLPSDDAPGAEPVALISYNVWRNYYAGQKNIVGSVSRINGEYRTIVGVMPQGFNYPRFQDVWMPLQLPTSPQPGQWQGLLSSGILADGVSIDSVSTELDALLLRLGASEPDFYSDLTSRITSCCSIINFDGPSPDKFLFPALMLSLILLVSLNVANLILVRTNQRIQEFGIRSAVGATRKRLIISVLQDSLLICLAGSVLGVVLAELSMNYVNAAATAVFNLIGGMPFWMRYDWEMSTALAALLVLLLIWVASVGLAVWQVYRQDLAVILAGGKHSASDSRGAFGTATIVSVEMIFSCFLLILSGVFVGTTIELADVDYGTATEGYLTARIELDTVAYDSAESKYRYRQNLQRELLNNEGIETVSFTTDLPSQAALRLSYNLEDRDVKANGEYPRKRTIQVADNYFDTMNVSLLAGRKFDGTDSNDSLPVVIIDELIARQLWSKAVDPIQAALGKRIQINPDSERAKWLTIVGVTPHLVQNFALEGGDLSSLYIPLSQPCCDYAQLPIYPVLKVHGDPNDYRNVLQDAAMRVDRDIPVADIVELSDFLDTLNSVVVFAAEMSSSIALVTLVLAITGIFAIVSRSVLQRGKEIGIRRAVGSSNSKVLWVFIRQGVQYLSMGLVLGGGTAILIASVVAGSNRLLDWLPVVFTGVSIGLALLVFIATYGPALRLVSIEPGETLRDE